MIKIQQIRFVCLFGAVLSSAAAKVDYSDYARLLDRYVEPDGVRYEAWASHAGDRAALDQFLAAASKVDVPALSVEAQKAFYINLYNAAMLQAVFDHWPIDSVKEIGLLPFSIFKRDFIEQGERRLSLDDVEKEILLQEYFDPRIHFAVNCASESCPPLRGEPFVAAKLDAQLEEQTRAFAASGRAVQVDRDAGRVELSRIFKWYADDFGAAGSVAYLNRYRDAPLPRDLEVDWMHYDWALNASD